MMAAPGKEALAAPRIAALTRQARLDRAGFPRWRRMFAGDIDGR